MTLEGIDISHWQNSTPSLAGKAFVFARATYGAHGDDRYLVHQINVRKAGKVFGAYHFSRPTSTGDSVAEQVASFLLMAKDADILALDWESDGRAGRMSAADARAFIAAVHKAGRRIGLYASESWFADLGQDFDWVANYTREPRRPYDIWQYRGSPLDLDRYRGTVAQLIELGTGPLPESSTEEPVGPTVLDPQPFVGTATIKADGKQHSAIQLDNGALVDLDAGITKRVIAKGKLATPWPGHPSGVVYLVGDEWAILLAEDVTPHETPDPTPYSKADLDAAVAATKASARVTFG